MTDVRVINSKQLYLIYIYYSGAYRVDGNWVIKNIKMDTDTDVNTDVTNEYRC